MVVFYTFDIPQSYIIYETEFTFVFLSHQPFLKYHILVSPKRVTPLLQDLTVPEHTDFFSVVFKVNKSLQKISDAQTITIQNGEHAGQTVKHVHMHIIPRNKGDLKENDEIYRKLDDTNRPKLTREETETQVEYLKKLFD